MYELELDLQLYFVPPMEESGKGIVVTRTIELPFVPSAEFSLYSSAFDELGSEPLGFSLKDLIWDIERKTFLAHTAIVSYDVPWPLIISDVQGWIERGWRLGSYKDAYLAKWNAAEVAKSTKH